MSDASPAQRSPGVLPAVLLAALVLVGGTVCVGVPTVGILAAVAIPNFVGYQLKAKRSEIPGYVQGIRSAELAYGAAFDTFLPVGSREEAEAALRSSGGKAPRPWEGGAGWETLGWRPDGPVLGAYWVEVDGDTLAVHGICDVDGDGEFAEYVATEEEHARLVTAPDVY